MLDMYSLADAFIEAWRILGRGGKIAKQATTGCTSPPGLRPEVSGSFWLQLPQGPERSSFGKEPLDPLIAKRARRH